MASSLVLQIFAVAAVMTLPPGTQVNACNTENKEVGVCLHVYLERDFLTLERIVYPRRNDRWAAMNNYNGPGQLQQLPPLPPLPDLDGNATHGSEDTRGRHQHRLPRNETKGSRARREAPDEFVSVDAYGRQGWVEGPELEDYCSRLGTVITCFEEVLINCDNGYDFFRYRHLLHSLDRVHHYLCRTPEDRSSKFLPFLKVIDCAEKAREKRISCHRPNVTPNVWNQILRAEVGPELCDSLNTQRACLLENQYLRAECGQAKEELYRNVSGLFLGTWCQLPLYHYYYNSASSQHQHAALYLSLLLLPFLLRVVNGNCLW